MSDFRIPIIEHDPWQPSVIAIQNAPPGSPAAGMRYLIGTSPSGDFAGKPNQIAWRTSTAWLFNVPLAGWRVWVNTPAPGNAYYFNGTSWKVELITGDFIKKAATSIVGEIPIWKTATGDEMKEEGLQIVTTIRDHLTSLDTAVATEKAVRTAINQVLGANDAMIMKGPYPCAGNPNYPIADTGHSYKVTSKGKIGGASGLEVEIGDMLVCTLDGSPAGTQAAVGSNWFILQTNIDGAVYFLGTDVTPGNLLEFLDGTGRNIKDSGISVASIVAHLADLTIHFTQAQIDHNSILNKGTNTHAQIDTHIATANIHRVMKYEPLLECIVYSE